MLYTYSLFHLHVLYRILILTHSLLLSLDVSASWSLELYHRQDPAHANQEKGRQILRLYRYETEQVQDGRGDELVVCSVFQDGSRAVAVRFTGIHFVNSLPQLQHAETSPDTTSMQALRPQASSCTGSNLRPMPEYINAPAMERILACGSCVLCVQWPSWFFVSSQVPQNSCSPPWSLYRSGERYGP